MGGTIGQPRTARAARRRAVALAVLAASWVQIDCRGDVSGVRDITPLVLVGIDGAEWSVVRELWSQGKLPHLRRLAERGTSAVLHTDSAVSPVIWTTIATGHRPRVHGITDFVVHTPTGDVPVSASLRRVPALWNMASTAGLDVGVVSWWASWPAEAVRGVVVSDRALLDVADALSPAAFASRFDEMRRTALARPGHFGGDPVTARRDQVTAEVSSRLAADAYDLLLVYFRGVDVASHHYWRHFRPTGFAEPPDLALAAEVPRVYEAVDEAIGALVAAAPETNVVVVSDHGFEPLPRESIVATLDFERVLEALGFLTGGKGAIDFSRTRVYSHATPPTTSRRRLRYATAGTKPGAKVLPSEIGQVRQDLDLALARVTWEDGSRAFTLRDPTWREAKDGAELIALFEPERATATLLIDGRPVPAAVKSVSRVSGTHDAETHGILIAAGPDIARGAQLPGFTIYDVAPTVLRALRLPIAADFAGIARDELFTAEIRQSPARTIATWGKPHRGQATRSRADEELVRELRALGYLQ